MPLLCGKTKHARSPALATLLASAMADRVCPEPTLVTRCGPKHCVKIARRAARSTGTATTMLPAPPSVRSTQSTHEEQPDEIGCAQTVPNGTENPKRGNARCFRASNDRSDP